MSPSTRSRAPQRLLRLLSLALIVAAIAIAITGGFTIAWGGLVLSAHRPVRLWLIGVALGLAGERLGAGLPTGDALRRLLSFGTTAIRASTALTVLAVGVTCGTFIAGGADSSGYISQAKLLGSGRLQLTMPPIAMSAPWPANPMVWVPLGWREGLTADSIVPTYAPGLPIVMAVAARLAGDWGMWLVVPMLGALAVWATGTIGRAIGGTPVALWSGLLLAVSPVFVNQLVQPMSDVPVAAWWTLAIALLAQSRWAAIRPAAHDRSLGVVFGAGLAAAMAIVTRPNLVPMLLPFVWFVARADRVPWRTALTRVVVFGLGVLPGVVVVAWLNTTWYGSPLESGYPSLDELFARDYIAINVQRYPRWLIETHTPFILIGLAAPFLLWWTRRRQTHRHVGAATATHAGTATDAPARAPASVIAAPAARDRAVALAWLCLGTVVMNAACYVAYIPFEHWTYLRFLLPAIPLMLLLSVVTLQEALRGLPWRLGIVATTIACAGLTHRSLMSDDLFFSRFTFVGESRYLEVATYVNEVLPRNAVLFSMQHSGSLRYYTRRPIVRWDRIEPAMLDRAYDALRARRLTPYFVLDDWEEAEFKARFGGTRLGALDWQPRVRTRLGPIVSIYDPAQRGRIPGTARPPVRKLP